LDNTVLEGFEPPELIEYILFTHHHFLEREMPRLEDLFRSALKTAGERHPEILEWLAHFHRFRVSLERHMKKEGREIFPFCLSRSVGMDPDTWVRELGARVQETEAQDAEALDQLKRLRKITDGYQVPEDAAPPLRYLLYDLHRLESEVKRHLKVEAEILFPKVLAAPPPPSTSDWRKLEEAPEH
jgi:regulator of cell morphogenesis and NO signaling